MNLNLRIHCSKHKNEKETLIKKMIDHFNPVFTGKESHDWFTIVLSLSNPKHTPTCFQISNFILKLCKFLPYRVNLINIFYTCVFMTTG